MRNLYPLARDVKAILFLHWKVATIFCSFSQETDQLVFSAYAQGRRNARAKHYSLSCSEKPIIRQNLPLSLILKSFSESPQINSKETIKICLGKHSLSIIRFFPKMPVPSFPRHIMLRLMGPISMISVRAEYT